MRLFFLFFKKYHLCLCVFILGEILDISISSNTLLLVSVKGRPSQIEFLYMLCQ